MRQRSVLMVFACVFACLSVRAGGAQVTAAEETAKAVRTLLERVPALSIEEAWDAASSLSGYKDTENVLKALQERLPAAGPRERLVIARALAMLDKPDESVDLLAAINKDAQAPMEVRVAACRALVVLPPLAGRKRTVELLDALLDAKEAELQLAAADGMLRFQGYTRAIRVLMQLSAREDAIGDEAALSLAENGYRNWVEERVLRIWQRPTANGRRAFLALRKKEEAFPGAPLLEEIYSHIQNYYVDWEELKDADLVDAAAHGIVDALDPFSSYLNKEDVEDMEESITGRYGGIGAYVGMRNGIFSIISPVYNGPAYRVGLRSLDLVYEVDGSPTAELRFMEVVKRLRGQPGSEVKVKVYRAGWPKPRDFTIVREQISIESALYAMLPEKIGYLRLTRFGDTTTKECREALLALKKEGARAYILDLRDNGGGLLEAAVETADLFIEKNRLLGDSVGRPTVSPRRNFFSTQPAVIGGDPLVVLVNTGSASASEIVAGALQDWKKATLVGEKTYGKGSVQTLLDLKGARTDSKLRLTVAKYYLPVGRCIHEKGVEPDVEVKAEELAAWKIDALAENEEKVEKYARGMVEKNPGIIAGLAEFDARDTKRYPGLDELIASISDRRIEPDDIRRYVRNVLRHQVADMRGKMFAADIEEDVQLRRAILETLKHLNVEQARLPEAYQGIFSEFPEEKKPELAAKAETEERKPAAEKKPEEAPAVAQ